MFDNTNDTRVVDEWTFGQYQDKEVARAALEKHWSTFITKDDFRQIQEAGYVLFISNANLANRFHSDLTYGFCGIDSTTFVYQSDIGRLTSIQGMSLFRVNCHTCLRQ